MKPLAELIVVATALNDRLAARKIELARKIKAEMALRGITGRRLAREIGVTETWVSLVIHGKRKSDRVRRAIAKALNARVEDLWPNDNHKRAA